MTKRFTLVLLALTFVVIVLGAYTRLSDAGLGCPDWPGCYGQLVVPNTDEQIARAQQTYPQSEFNRQKAWIEMIHRAAAGGLGLLIFLATLMDWRQARRTGSRVSRLLLLLCLAVIIQGLFGAWTVTLQLLPQVVVAHLFGGFLIFALVYLRYLALSARHPSPGYHPGLMRTAVGFGLVLLIIQILLGGWMSANYAALACVDFPLCGGSWVPAQMDFTAGFNFWQPLGPNYEGGVLPQAAQVAIHFTHRLVAVLLLAYWVVFYLVGRRLPLGNHAKHAMPMLLGLLLLQMALGITNVLGDLPLLVAVAHNGLAAILLLVVLRLFVLLGPAEQQSH